MTLEEFLSIPNGMDFEEYDEILKKNALLK